MPWTILNYAFRPFFLLNGLFAIVVIGIWAMALHGMSFMGLPVDTTLWHGHEMIVGFAMATIAGFVLTAVATWTGRPPVQGPLLGWLVTAWLVGRLAMALSNVLPGLLVALLDLSFPVMLCALAAREVSGGGSRRNYPIAGITAALALLDLLYHLGLGPLLPGADRLAVYLLIHLVLVLITVIAGRIVPNFTANWLRARGEVRLPRIVDPVERVTIGATLVVGITANIAPLSPLTGILAFVAATGHGIRLSRWRGLATIDEPLLFILHVAYLWLPIGYGLLGLATFGIIFPQTAALHALTMGGIGSMVLAVTTRVALAHTGRALHAARLTVIAYGIFTVAVVIRILSPLTTDGYFTMIDLAATGWILTFAIFSWVYWPILTRPRADGKPERPVPDPGA
jgi:uncharacterized protein involved in response to NO